MITFLNPSPASDGTNFRVDAPIHTYREEGVFTAATITWGDGSTSAGPCPKITKMAAIVAGPVWRGGVADLADLRRNWLHYKHLRCAFMSANVADSTASGGALVVFLGKAPRRARWSTPAAPTSASMPRSTPTAKRASSPSTPTFFVANSGGATWQLLGRVNYAEAGVHTVHWSVTDVDGDPYNTISGSQKQFSVADAPLTNTTPVTTRSLTGLVNSGPLVLATFSDANPFAPLSDFHTVTYWGDGSCSLGTIVLVSRTATASNWEVIGNHTYANPGFYGANYTATVAITDAVGLGFMTTNSQFFVAHHGRRFG